MTGEQSTATRLEDARRNALAQMRARVDGFPLADLEAAVRADEREQAAELLAMLDADRTGTILQLQQDCIAARQADASLRAALMDVAFELNRIEHLCVEDKGTPLRVEERNYVAMCIANARAALAGTPPDSYYEWGRGFALPDIEGETTGTPPAEETR